MHHSSADDTPQVQAWVEELVASVSFDGPPACSAVLHRMPALCMTHAAMPKRWLPSPGACRSALRPPACLLPSRYPNRVWCVQAVACAPQVPEPCLGAKLHASISQALAASPGGKVRLRACASIAPHSIGDQRSSQLAAPLQSTLPSWASPLFGLSCLLQTPLAAPLQKAAAVSACLSDAASLMLPLMLHTFCTRAQVVVVGTDVPDLTADVLAQAFAALDTYPVSVSGLP